MVVQVNSTLECFAIYLTIIAEMHILFWNILLSRNTMKHNITIIFANGDVRIKKQFRNLKIKEGSTIIVQTKESKEPFNITEFSTSMASIVTSLATLALLISSQ